MTVNQYYFRPSKVARLSPSAETETVWTSVVKKPGILTLKRLSAEEEEQPFPPPPPPPLTKTETRKKMSTWNSCTDMTVNSTKLCSTHYFLVIYPAT